MKKVIASIILCTSIFMSGCSKEIKNVDNISTNVYIFIKDDKVIDYKVDEYNGSSNADIVNLFKFF